jgi:hypothetical protein
MKSLPAWGVAVVAVGLAAGLLAPARAPGFELIGGSLALDQRDVRVFDNFGDATANDNATAAAGLPGATGAELALWKAAAEWGSELHADGQGDPHQPGDLGSGSANFDASWQGNALSTGNHNQNIHSEISGSSGGVLAYCETPISDGWRIRYYADWIWDDGPLAPLGALKDLQGVATHEYGHALGLGHSTSVGATMYPSAAGSGVAQRSLAADDVAGVQALYGPKSPMKPRIVQVEVDVLAQTARISGAHFLAAGNEVWFTRAGASAASADPVVKVGGLAASADGTRIDVAIPPVAGPGDVLVRVPGASHASLSNAWPLDPALEGSPFGPPLVTGIAPAAIPCVSPAPTTVSLSGSGFLGLVEVRLAGQPLDPALVHVLSDAALALDIVAPPFLGPLALEVENAFGSSAPAMLTVFAPDPPALALASPAFFSGTPVLVRIGGPPSTSWVLAGSLILAPSVLPGILAADIGGQFQSLVLLGSGILASSGSAEFPFALANLPFGTEVHVQAATLGPGAPAPPYAMTNVATGTFYF